MGPFLSSCWAAMADTTQHENKNDTDDRSTGWFWKKGKRAKRISHQDVCDTVGDAGPMHVDRWQAQEDLRVPLRRIRHSITWLRAFFQGRVGALTRTFDLTHWLSEPFIEITTDASPWGLGAVLTVHGRIWAVLSDELQEDDLKRFQLVKGDCRGQTL